MWRSAFWQVRGNKTRPQARHLGALTTPISPSYPPDALAITRPSTGAKQITVSTAITIRTRAA